VAIVPDLQLTDIQTALDAAGGRWRAGPTTLSHLSLDEARMRLGYVPGPEEPTLEEREQQATAALSAVTIRFARDAAGVGPAVGVGFPASFSWQNVAGHNYITPVRDQGGCGSCVAFGSTATVEGTLRVLRDDPDLNVDLSEADLFYCIAASQGRNCANGWWVPPALDGYKTEGVPDEACFPYTAGNQPCNRCGDWAGRVTRVPGWHQITDHNQMKAWLSTRGPLATCFTVYQDFYSYVSGVYHHVTGGVVGGHCVCVIGYDDAGQFWICKNSWGAGWGEGGFFCIGYGECGIDATMWAVDAVDSNIGTLEALFSVGRNQDGRLEVFARGTDLALHHIWQTAPNNGWSGWNGLGGELSTLPLQDNNADGRLEIFARGTDNGLYHIWQTAPNNGWSGWGGLGGILTGAGVVGRNLDGRLEVFVRGADDALYHIWQTAPNNGWSGFASLGGTLTSDPVANVNADGRIELFARGADGALWHIWQTSPNNGWSGWASLSGGITSTPAVGRNLDGRLEVFARGNDGALWHIWQTSPNNGWSGWASLGGLITSAPVAASNLDGRIEVFARGVDRALWHVWQTAPNNGWSGWASQGGVLI